MITPQEKEPRLAEALGIKSLYFKREDLHPLLSHKGRSIPFMIDYYRKEGKTYFAISSSGNAALAALMHIQKINSQGNEKIKLDIFIGEHINQTKEDALRKLSDEYCTITKTPRPLQTLFATTSDSLIQPLRQSNDDTALLGYESLAEELATIDDLKAIFIPTSSGTTAEALALYFKKIKKNVEINIVQTMSCHPLAAEFTDVMETDEVSFADAIVDKTALRKNTLTELITESGGSGYVASNDEIKNAEVLIEKNTNITLSHNSTLSVVGLMQAIYTGKKWNGSVVCLITGK